MIPAILRLIFNIGMLLAALLVVYVVIFLILRTVRAILEGIGLEFGDFSSWMLTPLVRWRQNRTKH